MNIFRWVNYARTPHHTSSSLQVRFVFPCLVYHRALCVFLHVNSWLAAPAPAPTTTILPSDHRQQFFIISPSSSPPPPLTLPPSALLNPHSNRLGRQLWSRGNVTYCLWGMQNIWWKCVQINKNNIKFPLYLKVQSWPRRNFSILRCTAATFSTLSRTALWRRLI